MSDLPSGVVTLLFTDIEGSTQLARKAGDRWPELLHRHDALLRDVFKAHSGHEVGTAGDSFFVVFTRARDAAAAAIDAQLALAGHRWPEGERVRVRIGMHTGEATVSNGSYVGVAVHRAARICAAGHGGQILVSPSTRALLEDVEDLELRDLGQHRLKDFDRPVQLYQLDPPGLAGSFAPLRSEPENGTPGARIQLCGRFAVRFGAHRLDDDLRSASCRMLFAYLVLNRDRPLGRDELCSAVGCATKATVSRLLASIRRAVGEELLPAGADVRLALPLDTFVDVEAAVEALHRAESCIARGDFAEAWGPAGVAAHVAARPFLPGLDADWIERWRRRLAEVHVRGLECYGGAALGVGGAELPVAEQTGSVLIETAPDRESGYRMLMEAYARRGNTVEALRVFEKWRARLAEELGVPPSPALQALYDRLTSA